MLKLKQKQQRAIEAANDPRVSTIVLIGVVGSGKTDVVAHISLSIAYTFPRTYWLVFRQNISTAKRSVIPSYLNMLDLMNLVEGADYHFNRQDYEIAFPHNGSKIGFVEADVTKDRQGRKIKGINATGSHIDEADELDQTMFITALSRRGRRNESGQPSLSLVTMNPNDSHLKALYYEPWKAGTLPPDTVVIEFTLEDSWQSPADIEALNRNPKPWRERYLNNNWSYQDDIDSLFKYRFFDAAITSELDNNAPRYLGYDVARSGQDRSVAALWYGKTLVDIQIIKDHDEQMTTDDQALWLIKYLTQNATLPGNANVDAVGLGVGVIDFMKSRGMLVQEFISGATPTSDTYDKLRSEVIYTFSQGLEKGEIKIYEGCPFRNELISEAMAHNHKTTDKKLAVESKEEVKKRTGSLSPDIFDAVVMGLRGQLNLDPRRNTKRIAL
jgi:hypothetical protein